MLYILTKWILYHILYPRSKMDIISYQYPEKSRDIYHILYHILFWRENLNKYYGELHNTYIIHGHDPHDIKPPLERKFGLLLSPKPPPFTHRCHFFLLLDYTGTVFTTKKSDALAHFCAKQFVAEIPPTLVLVSYNRSMCLHRAQALHSSNLLR